MEDNRPISIDELPVKNDYVGVEPEITEVPEEEKSNVIEYKLKSPITFEGERIERFVLDFDSLTGRDIEDACKSLSVDQKIGILEAEKTYLAALAAKSAGYPVELMQYLKAKDYTEITIKVQNFLLD